VAASGRAPQAATADDPFTSLRACVAPTTSDLGRLDAGGVIVRTLPADDRDVSVFAARRVSVSGDRLLAWVDAIDLLKRSPAVHAIGRWSEPPRVEDLDGLTLEPRDAEVLRNCRPGDCAFKLTSDERQRVLQAGSPGVQAAFRDLLLRRVHAYQRDGLAALGRYDDGRTPLSIEETSQGLLSRLPCVKGAFPGLAQGLDLYPALQTPPALSFFYWSKEEFRGRPVILATHVMAVQQRTSGRTETVVAGRQIYAAHYMNAGLNLTGVIDMPDGRHYLFVLNRSSVDVLSGMFGGVVRGVVERRLRSDVSTVIEQVARRLESGDPIR
jgi:hypothetical protein